MKVLSKVNFVIALIWCVFYLIHIFIYSFSIPQDVFFVGLSLMFLLFMIERFGKDRPRKSNYLMVGLASLFFVTALTDLIRSSF